MLHLTLQHDLNHQHTPTPGTLAAAALFGLTLQPTTTTPLIPPTPITLYPGQVTLLTGTSGGGKSTALRLIAQHLQTNTIRAAHQTTVLWLDPEEDLPAAALIDGFTDVAATDDATDDTIDATPPDTLNPAAAIADPLRWLSLAGLGDAHLMLRRPTDLSEGQRHRYRLARLFAQVDQLLAASPGVWPVVLADEFLTPLDRTTALAVARATARWARSQGVSLIAATAHDDLLEPLDADLLLDFSPSGLVVSSRADFTAEDAGFAEQGKGRNRR